MKTKKQAIVFWSQYFGVPISEADCNEMTIDCMVKFANSKKKKLKSNPSKKTGMSKDVLKPSPQLLIKLGSIIVHYEEWTSKKGHELDKNAIDSLMDDDEVKEWLKEMDAMAFLPKKR